jgi:hypothetical protein
VINQTINNNTQNNTQNNLIVINPFGKEDLSHVKLQDYKNYLLKEIKTKKKKLFNSDILLLYISIKCF